MREGMKEKRISQITLFPTVVAINASTSSCSFPPPVAAITVMSLGNMGEGLGIKGYNVVLWPKWSSAWLRPLGSTQASRRDILREENPLQHHCDGL